VKILFLSPLLGVGGEEISTLSLIKEMIKRGHQVYIYGNDSPLSKEIRGAGATHVVSNGYRRTFRGLMSDVLKINEIIKKNRINIVHSQSVLPTISCFIAISVIGRLTKTKLIFHNRGLHEYSYAIIGRLFNYFTDLVITNSDYERTRLIKNGLKESHCIRIYNSINIDFPREDELYGDKGLLGFDRDTLVVGTVGRLVKEKGIQFLLRAIKLVTQSYKKIMFVFIGEGNLRKILEKEADSLGINKNVLFTGTRRDLKKIYPIFDFFVISSVFETFCNVALEAAAFGKAVIATKVGGLPEAVSDGKTGILVPLADVQRLAETITYFIENTDIADRMGRYGRKRIKEYFCVNRVGDEIERIYKKLLDDQV